MNIIYKEHRRSNSNELLVVDSPSVCMSPAGVAPSSPFGDSGPVTYENKYTFENKPAYYLS